MTASLTAPAAPADEISAYIAASTKAAWDVKGLSAGTPIKPIKKVGVLGAGTMGGGISMNFLNAGIPVKILEMKQEALDRGIATIRKNYEAQVKKGRLTQEKVEALIALIQPSLSYDDLNNADLIIEAVFENMALKKDIFAELDKRAKPGALLASRPAGTSISMRSAVNSLSSQICVRPSGSVVRRYVPSEWK